MAQIYTDPLPPVTEVLSLGQYYSIDCITGPVPTGVSVSWILTNGSIYSNSNTLVISSILPSHHNSHYTCIIKVVNLSIVLLTVLLKYKPLLLE